jgi:hypothetical protein
MDTGLSLNHKVMRFNETQVNILKNIDKKKNMKKVATTKKTGMIVEKKTGEKYASKSAMMKHEKSEGKKIEKKEEAKKGFVPFKKKK